MTERRSHWSDDLIDAVFRIMDDYAAEVWRREWDHGTPTFDIIAAVEDWQDANGFSRAGTMMNRLIEAEAAIQRVREIHKQTALGWQGICFACSVLDVCADDERWIVRVPYPCATIRALDGDA